MTCIEDLAGRAVLITGASSGIGAALARAFGVQSSKLALHFDSHELSGYITGNLIPVNGGMYMP